MGAPQRTLMGHIHVQGTWDTLQGTVFLPFRIHQHDNMEPLRLKKNIVSQCIYLKKEGKKASIIIKKKYSQFLKNSKYLFS